jgi:hypothetical protein
MTPRFRTTRWVPATVLCALAVAGSAGTALADAEADVPGMPAGHVTTHTGGSGLLGPSGGGLCGNSVGIIGLVNPTAANCSPPSSAVAAPIPEEVERWDSL